MVTTGHEQAMVVSQTSHVAMILLADALFKSDVDLQHIAMQ